jgi:hypothetical protein
MLTGNSNSEEKYKAKNESLLGPVLASERSPEQI